MYVYCINPNKKALECTEIQFELLLLVYSVGVLYELYLQHFNKNDKNESSVSGRRRIIFGLGTRDW